jgi:hypothetical protein
MLFRPEAMDVAATGKKGQASIEHEFAGYSPADVHFRLFAWSCRPARELIIEKVA